MNTADQHAAALAIVHEEAGRTLSKDDFDLCMRIAKRALASDAAQAPVAVIGSGWKLLYASREPLAAIVERHELKIGDKLYAAPVAPAAAEPKMVAACCGRSECGGECGNEWRGMVPAQPDERAAFDLPRALRAMANEHINNPGLSMQLLALADRAAAPRAMLTDEQILNAFELSGVEFQEVYSTTLKKWLPLTKGTQNANRLISAVRALLAAQPPRTPIYQIGANAGGGIAWWDVDKDRYEREKKAGFMKTGIVYREGK